MTAYTTDLTEEGRAFLQQRVALFAKVGIGVQALGLTGLLAQYSWEQLRQPWFALYQVQTGLAVGAWLLCRGGMRSVRFVSRVEATMLLGIAAVSATVSRLLLPVSPEFLGSGVSPNDAAYGRFVGVVQGSVLLEFVIGLSLWVFVRAALVPSRPLRTLALTALAAVPLAVVTVVRTLPFESEPSLRSVTPDDLVVMNVIRIAIWWTFITGVCTIVSAVIFGLRREAREARRLGQYTLEAKLGEGGMGVVYRASHAMMRRPTAVKLLRAEKAGEQALRRFEREVQLTAELSHPNTVSIYDFGRTQDGIFYYAMEYLDGIDLQRLVDEDGAQLPERVVHILRQVLGALAEAHGVGLIHRDIKPGNIILCERGGVPDVAKVVDFGLVKELDTADGLSHEGTLVGTPLYMAPESIRSGAADPRSDIYAVGAVGYYLLTGVHVFTGQTVMEICGHHLHTQPVSPSERIGHDLPPDLETWVMHCLEKLPTNRPGSAAEAAEELANAYDVSWDVARAHDWWRINGGNFRRVDAKGSSPGTIAVDVGRIR